MIIEFLKKNIQSSKGFTLIETLVAISILMIAVAGPLTIAHKGLFSALYAKDQIAASFLAQDALEYVRYMRDTNVLASGTNGWLNNLDDCFSACEIDTTKDISEAVRRSEEGMLRKTEDIMGGANKYGYTSGWKETKFKREVTIEKLGDDIGNEIEIKVAVTVAWDAGAFPKKFTVEEYLFKR